MDIFLSLANTFECVVHFGAVNVSSFTFLLYNLLYRVSIIVEACTCSVDTWTFG